jgi:hypothetical protein
VEAQYAAGKNFSLSIADTMYSNDDPTDRTLVTGYDRSFLRPALTDAMLTLYNKVARILRERHPQSRSLIGGMAYTNVTMPPRQVRSLEPNIVMWLAPIDVDPNHAMDDPRSPPRLEYGEAVRRWSQVTGGRLAIYDYDQGMLVWRDLPNPSHHVFARDAKLYRAAGILGFGTESRGALATVFLNLFFRGQLMWDPDADVAALLSQFYADFYGPAAAPMSRYWGRLFKAWEDTHVTEHEHFVISAIYTPDLVDAMRADLAAAEAIAKARAPADLPLLRERLRFTRLSFEIIDNYTKMVSLAAGQAEFGEAAKAGERALTARQALADMSPLFVNTLDQASLTGPAWFAGEVQQMRELAALVDGREGELIERLPLTWSFLRAEPLPEAWTYEGPQGAEGSWDTGRARDPVSPAGGWQQVRTDLYLQAQGILAPNRQTALGHYWYRTSLTLRPGQLSGARIRFPGLFNEAWLYVNGALVAHRDFREPWWVTDYGFQWDVDLAPHLRPGNNLIALRGFNPHHMGGMFRRPFLYRKMAKEGATAAELS